MKFGLDGQVAVIAGGANGIGRAIAAAFLAEGCRVALWDRDPQVESVANELRSSVPGNDRPEATGWQVDVTDYAAVCAARDALEAHWGEARHIIFAVGAGSGKFGFPFWNLEPHDWERVLRINLVAAVNLAHAYGERLASAQAGSILFISSVAGQIGSQTDPPYSAAKAALINFAQCAAKDLAPSGVRVNTICPGMIQTALNRSVWQAWHDRQPPESRRSYEDWAGEKVRRTIPMGRWQRPEDVAALAVFLASAQAENITGQTLNVDGGWVMHS